MLKYYASMLNLDNPGESPMFTGRLNLALLDTEPGYYHSSTYYGSKKQLIAIGVGAQYQNDGASRNVAPPGTGQEVDDFTEINADVLAEFDVGGVVTVEGGYYHFDGLVPSSAAQVEQYYYALASYLFADKLGWGKLQPLVRIQQGMDPDYELTAIDAELSYVIADYNMKVNAGYQYTKIDPGAAPELKGNALHLGVQIQQ
jgi:hypothetical protein